MHFFLIHNYAQGYVLIERLRAIMSMYTVPVVWVDSNKTEGGHRYEIMCSYLDDLPVSDSVNPLKL